MVGVLAKCCAEKGCSKWQNFGVEGSNRAVYCSQDAAHGLLDARGNPFAQEDCTKWPNFGVESLQG